MIKVLSSKVGGELLRRLQESEQTRDVLSRVNEQLGISDDPAVAAELHEQPEVSPTAASPERHVVHKGAEE